MAASATAAGRAGRLEMARGAGGMVGLLRVRGREGGAGACWRLVPTAAAAARLNCKEFLRRARRGAAGYRRGFNSGLIGSSCDVAGRVRQGRRRGEWPAASAQEWVSVQRSILVTTVFPRHAERKQTFDAGLSDWQQCPRVSRAHTGCFETLPALRLRLKFLRSSASRLWRISGILTFTDNCHHMFKIHLRIFFGSGL